MENCSSYFHIKQDINENPFEANREFTIKQIITYLSILQAISGSERKTFQSKKLTFTNFYIFITKTNALHFRCEGGRVVVTGIFPCIPTLVTLGMTPSLFHFFLFSSFIPPWECPLEALFCPLSSQFSILLGRTFNPLKGGGDWQFGVTGLCCILNWKKNSLFWFMTMISVVWALHEYLIPSIGCVICTKKIVSLITYYSKGCRSVAIPSGHSYFWLL